MAANMRGHIYQHRLSTGKGPLGGTRTSRCTVVRIFNAFKRPVVQPPVVTPEEKTLQSMVETGIRGSVAMAAAYALHLNLWSHMHWEPSHIITGLQAAAPCLSMEAALLLISNSLSLPVNSRHKAAAAPQLSSSGGGLPVGAMQDAVDAVYLHNMRYSLIGAAVGVRRWLLEAGAQLSDDLLARGVLLGCSTAWLTSRLFEAGVCQEPMLLPGSTPHAGLCASGVEWLAATAICCMIAGRYDFHSKSNTSNLRGRREAAAAEAATQQKLLRYEPKAVQDKAAAAATASGAACTSMASCDEENEKLVAKLVHGWLGARFVVGQAGMFAAFISTDDLLASFAAGLAMQMVSNVCCEQYLRRGA